MFKTITIAIISVVLLTGCADFLQRMHEDWVRENCSPNGAYNAGLTDGMTPNKLPNRYFANECPMDQEQLNTFYLKGFTKGLRSRPTEVNINKRVVSDKKEF